MSNDIDNMDCGIKKDSIVQVNENGPAEWIGCLIQVSEIRKDGIQGWIQVPMTGPGFIHFKWSEIDYIGDAVMGIDGKQLKEKK